MHNRSSEPGGNSAAAASNSRNAAFMADVLALPSTEDCGAAPENANCSANQRWVRPPPLMYIIEYQAPAPSGLAIGLSMRVSRSAK